jgi:lipoprotein Spr
MKQALAFIAALGIILGCQGTPRYGGGRYSDEGDKIAEKQSQEQSQEQSPQAPAGPTRYAVDPIEMGKIIDRYLGRPYGDSAQAEKMYDCSDFIGAVYFEYASVHLPRTAENLFKAGRVIESGDLYFGDLVFFDTGGQGVSHVGIYVGFDEFVHSSSNNGIVISSLKDDYYSKRYVGARRVME